MPSEYEIYRAYAGINQPKSGFDYFMEGLKEIQAGAREDKRLALQERSQDRADETMRFNKEQTVLDNQRMEKIGKDKELNDLIGAARTDYQRAQIYRSVGGGKYDDIAADLEQNWRKQESVKGLYTETFYGTEEERTRKLSDFINSADPTNPLFEKAVVRRNKLLGDIADTADEILADPEFGPSYERFSNIIKGGGTGVGINQDLNPEENIEIARKGLIQVEKEHRAKKQRFFKEGTKRTSTIGAVDVEDYEPVVDYLLEGTETGSLFAGIEDPIGGEDVAEAGGRGIAAGGVGLDIAEPKPLDKDASVQDYVDAYKSKGESEISSRVSREGSIISKLTTPSSEWKEGKVSDRYKAYVGLERQLDSADRDLSNLQRTKGGKMIAGVSKKEWDKQYKKSASMYKKSLQDIYNLYQQLKEDELKSKKGIQKAGSVRGEEAGANNWFKNNLKNILMNEKKRRSDASFYEVYSLDPEIKEILDSISL